MEIYSGKQITKDDGRNNIEHGFAVSVDHKNDFAFCRYFIKDTALLRTMSISERTPLSYLKPCQAPQLQSYIDKICGNILLHREPFIHDESYASNNQGQVFILKNTAGNCFNPLDKKLTIPVHSNLSGLYAWKNPGYEARYFILARIGGAHDWAAYQGFADIDMPLNNALEAIIRFGDKIGANQANELVKKNHITGLFKNLRYRM